MGEAPQGFGPRLRQARLARGLSVPQLAQQSEVPVSTISRYENGQRTNPELHNVQRLARALQVTLKYLGEEDWDVRDL